MRLVACLTGPAAIPTIAMAQAAPSAVAPRVTLVIRRVAVLPMNRDTLLRDRDVIIDGNRITAIVPAGGKLPAKATTIEGRGLYLMPGLWDAHAHTLDTPERTFELLLQHGVTSVRDMGGALESLALVRRAIADHRLVAPRLWAAGPLLDGPRQRWSQRGSWHLTNADSVSQAVDSLLRGGVDFLKVYNTLSASVYQEVARVARLRGVTFAGHVPFAVTATEAVQAGQRSLEHAGLDITTLDCVRDGGSRFRDLLGVWGAQGYGAYLDGMAQLRAERDPACVGRLYERYRDAGTWITPTMVNTIKDSATVNWSALALVDSVSRAACVGTVASFHKASDMQRARYHREFREDVAALHRAGVRLVAGTDIPNPCLVPGASLHDELSQLVEAGMTPFAALQAATVNAAQLVGAADSVGTVGPGMLADLVLVGADPRRRIGAVRDIRYVIRNGVPVAIRR